MKWFVFPSRLERAPRARLARLARVAQRGVTLIEILIVLAIIGLIAGGVAMTAVPQLEKAKVQTTRQGASEVRKAAQLWRTTGGTDCPSVETLKTEKLLDRASKVLDGWDQPFKIYCEDDETTVVSAGKDKKEGTPDDIKVPSPEPTK